MKSLVIFVLIGLRLAADTTIDIDAELKKVWPDNRTVNVVFHGHSVPSGYHLTPRVKPFESYPHLFRIKMAEQYPNAVFNIITTAIGGENSVAGAARFESDVLPFKPDLILIDYALNDRPLPLTEVEAAWRSMIASAKAANIPLILITPTGATNADFSDSEDPLSIRAALIRSLAKELDVMLADVSSSWQAALASGTDQSTLLSQGNHPNLQGHQLAADTLWDTYLAGLGSLRSISATDFPRDQSTSTFSTTDSRLTFTTTNTFSGQGNFIGDSGGAGNRTNSYDGDETLKLTLTPDAQLTGFSLRWTVGKTIISGFTSDPLASINNVNGVSGSATWNPEDSTLTLNLPWDNGAVRTVTFGAPAASLGSTLNFSFTNESPGWQTSFVSFDYQLTPTVPGAFIANPRMIRDGDTINFQLSGRKDFQYALITSTTLRTSSWSQLDRIGPLEIDREIVLSDPGPLPDQRFYRIAITEPNQP